VEYAPRAESGPIFNFQSLIENYERCCGLGFWVWARRRRRSTTRGFESSSHLGKNTPERKDNIMDKLVVPVEECGAAASWQP